MHRVLDAFGAVPDHVGLAAAHDDAVEADAEVARALVRVGGLEQPRHVERAVGPLPGDHAGAAHHEVARRERPPEERGQVVVHDHGVHGHHHFTIAADRQTGQAGAAQKRAREGLRGDLNVVGEHVGDLLHDQPAGQRAPGAGLQEDQHARDQEDQPQAQEREHPPGPADRPAPPRCGGGRFRGAAIAREGRLRPVHTLRDARLGGGAVARGGGVGAGGIGRHGGVNAGAGRKV